MLLQLLLLWGLLQLHLLDLLPLLLVGAGDCIQLETCYSCLGLQQLPTAAADVVVRIIKSF